MSNARTSSAWIERLGLVARVHGWSGASGLALVATSAPLAATGIAQDSPDSTWRPTDAVAQSESSMRRALAPLDRLMSKAPSLPRGAASHPCDDAAELFVQVGATVEYAFPLGVQASAGEVQVTMLSGTLIGDIVRSLDRFAMAFGFGVEVSPANPDRVHLWSSMAGGDATLIVRDVDGVQPIVYRQAVGGSGQPGAVDSGTTGAPGDATCDGIVNVQDLWLVIDEWGDCSACGADVTRDGVVDTQDLLLVLEHWD